jgi:hypothetical protein
MFLDGNKKKVDYPLGHFSKNSNDDIIEEISAYFSKMNLEEQEYAFGMIKEFQKVTSK